MDELTFEKIVEIVECVKDLKLGNYKNQFLAPITSDKNFIKLEELSVNLMNSYLKLETI